MRRCGSAITIDARQRKQSHQIESENTRTRGRRDESRPNYLLKVIIWPLFKPAAIQAATKPQNARRNRTLTIYASVTESPYD